MLRRTTVVFFASLVLALVPSCGSGSRVNIEVVTGLVPGPEFAYVVTEMYPPGDDSQGLVRVLHAEAVSRFRDEYLRGHRVASFDGIPQGEQTVRVSLLRPDRTLLVSQEIALTVNAATVLARIRVDRDCVAVECPTAASPGATACYGGHCADPRCNPTDPSTFEFCGSLRFCNADADCPMPAACATRHCVEGNCAADPYVPTTPADACGGSEWCDPTNGCATLPGDAPADAGLDASMLGGDGAVGDAGGGGDAGVCYQTICENPAYPCFYSYVDCASPTQDCVPFVRRETGSSCGGTSICSSSAVCLACPGAPSCDPTSDVDGDGVPDRMDVETCDGLDDDGDGTVDEGLPLGAPSYLDADGDMHGDPATAMRRCAGLTGVVAIGDDCDDTSASISPDAIEVCNTLDDDCDMLVDGADSSISMPFGGGDGSVATPYLICTRAHFAALASVGDPTARYRQIVDLDLGGSSVTPVGAPGIDPDLAGGGFSGDYDGGGHTLANVAIHEASAPLAGLFRKLEASGRVHDLVLTNVTLDGRDVVGTVAGTSFGTVERVTVMGGTVASHGTAGGLVGHLRGGTIDTCTTSNLTVSSAADSARVGTTVDTGVGGALGVMYGGTISTTTASGTRVSWSAAGTSIAAWTFSGGLVGYVNGGTVTGSRVTGTLDAVLSLGGFVGACEGTGTLTDDYADVDVTGVNGAGGFAGTDKCNSLRLGARGDVVATAGTAGGFADYLECDTALTMRELFATGNVTAVRTAGGFANVIRPRSAAGGAIGEISGYGILRVGSAGSVGGLAATFQGCTITDAVMVNESITGLRRAAWIAVDTTGIGTTASYLRAALALPDEATPMDYPGVSAISDAALQDDTMMPPLDFTTTWAIASSRTDGRMLGPVLRRECGTDGITCR